ncbi:probable transmembrane reductase CYB561D1 [Sitodiplosis mosellana]|uniref:probable transmembrane reductase CYB561D1 n=1 Tax=Sitodiplosis mosellana TaxID=263140 RepID=UPI002443A070|nr:probable transmembrane reductase CYB561D1 [Sitodiplosis mosellana]
MEKAIRAFQFLFNILNHICIVVVTIYVTWHCFLMNLSDKFIVQYDMHVWLCTLGYQLMMAEAILTLYSSNCWSFFYAPKTKRTLHWLIQVIGSLMAIVGTTVFYSTRQFHFQTTHSITGLISLIFAVVGCINGIAAINTQKVYKKYRIRPVVSKMFHKFIGIASFVLGMMSLFYG